MTYAAISFIAPGKEFPVDVEVEPAKDFMTDVQEMASEFVDQINVSEDFEADLRLLMPSVIYTNLREQAEDGTAESLSPDEVDRWLAWEAVVSMQELDLPAAFLGPVELYLKVTPRAKHEAMLAHIKEGVVSHG